MTRKAARARRAPRSSARRPASAPRSLGGPILVAVDDPDAAEGALHVADLVARRDRVNAHLLGVAPPLALPTALALPVDHETLDGARRQQLQARLRAVLSRTLGLAAYWSTEALVGHPATTIARVGRERASALTVLGLPASTAPQRTAREDAALQIIRAASGPVLVVPPDTAHLPQHALVAMDFSPASRQAARAALALLGAGGTLTIAHVQPPLDFASAGKPGLDAIYERGMRTLLDDVTTELRADGQTGGDVTIDTALVRGDPAPALLTLAREGNYDLIAAGTQGVTPLDRYLVGSVSTALLRGARGAVLIVPAHEAGAVA